MKVFGRGEGGDIGLAFDPDAVFIVDDQFASLTPKILTAIAALTNRPVRFVLNTHWHFDHTGGNENMGKAGAFLIAHDNFRRRMFTRQFIEYLKREEPASPLGALPVVTFSDAVTLHLDGYPTAAFDAAWGGGFIKAEDFVQFAHAGATSSSAR